jgi:nucleoside-diphosphate-sugar epimerase
LTYVSDTVEGFLVAGLAPGVEGETIQLGTGRTDSVGDVFAVACAVCGVDAHIVADTVRIRPERSEVMVLQSDPSRAQSLLGWSAQVSLEDGLRRSAEWIRAHMQYFSVDQYTI